MNFRQYNRPVDVQAAEIIAVEGPDAVRVRDNDGIASVITVAGLFKQGAPEPGDKLVLWPATARYPYGRTTWISADDWAVDEWEPARGPILS